WRLRATRYLSGLASSCGCRHCGPPRELALRVVSVGDRLHDSLWHPQGILRRALDDHLWLDRYWLRRVRVAGDGGAAGEGDARILGSRFRDHHGTRRAPVAPRFTLLDG